MIYVRGMLGEVAVVRLPNRRKPAVLAERIVPWCARCHDTDNLLALVLDGVGAIAVHAPCRAVMEGMGYRFSSERRRA